MNPSSIDQSPPWRPLFVLLLIAFCSIQMQACGQTDNTFERVLQFNGQGDALFDARELDSLLATEQTLSTARRVGLGARRFLADPASEYCFGLHDGGYVAEGLIVSDHRQDCVSLLYRSSELARAQDHDEAIRVALDTRFAGAALDSVVDAAGRVDYERPEHLDYSLDMIRGGHWGKDITAQFRGARPDAEGTSRYPAKTFPYVPTASLDTRQLKEGDVIWLVLNPANASALRLREEYGLAIGHIGLIIEENGEVLLVHAASSELAGVYEGGRVVAVPIRTYLERVDRFRGIMVTRFDH